MTRSKKFFLSIVVIVVLGIAIYSLFSYKNTLPPEMITLDYKNPQRDVEIKIPKEKVWFADMKKERDFAYPASEAHFSLNFLDPSEVKKRRNVIIKSVDKEKLFCLKELFKDKKIDFAYNKSENNLDIVVYLPQEREEKILQMLHYYGIAYQNN
ncbi:hypothetical protein CQA57_05095 [Helicobacter anseris]|uniref:Periplasmic protein n=1 Tax=Helicobacter anseris TaxID=375926 RepID=A0A3D8J7V8_9HELI|nr:hypothetical protein CQA57_05095 [Helicobacter anseris]